MKIYLHFITSLFSLILLTWISTQQVFAQEVFRDNFNIGVGGWATRQNAREETFICGQACKSVKLSNTTASPSDGRIADSFPVTPGATYRIDVTAGVFTGGSSPNGQIILTATDGSGITQSSSCSSCQASESSIMGSLSLTIVPRTSTMTIYVDGRQGGCNASGCHDPYIDDFVLTQTAPPACNTLPTKTTCGQTTYAENCNNESRCSASGATASTTFTCTAQANPSCTYTYTCNTCAGGGAGGAGSGGELTCPVNSTCCEQPLKTCVSNSQCTTIGYHWCYDGYCVKDTYIPPGQPFEDTCPNQVCIPGERQWDAISCRSRTCNSNGTAWNSWGSSCSDFGTEAFTSGSSSCNCAVACKDTVSPSQHPACFPSVSVSCSASPTATTPNTTVTWTAQVSGGTPPFNFTWSQDVSDTGTISSYTFAKDTKYTTTGIKTAQINITDAAGKTATNTCTANITNALSVSCSPNNQTVTSGTTTTVSAQASGGSGNYSSYNWSGDTTGSTTGQSINVQYTTNSTRIYQVQVRVTDSAGVTSPTSAACNITVTPPGALTLNPPTSNCTIATPPTPYVDLSWTPPSGFSFNDFQIFRQSTPIFTALGSQTTYRDSNVTSGSTYTYMIRGTTTSNQIIDSNSASKTVNTCSGGGGLPTCSLSANPASGTGPFSSSIRVTYANLTSAPGTIAINCGNGSGSSASGCGGLSGSCSSSATCSYDQIVPPAPAAPYTVTASIGSSVTCSTTITNNPSGSGPALLPWIQTTEGDVHSNTRIDTPGGPE